MATKNSRRPTVTNTDDERRFWEILTRTAPANKLPFTRVNLSALGDLHVQLFEVLVTETLADSCPEFTWYVTQVVGDHGIDLHGHSPVVECWISTTHMAMSYIVLGQVKRSREYTYDAAVAIIEKIVDATRSERIPISHLVVVISGAGNTPQRYRLLLQRKARERLTGVSLNVIDAAAFVACWQTNPRGVADALSEALDDPEAVMFVERYLSAQPRSGAGRWSVKAGPPLGARVPGALLDVQVRIKAPVAMPGYEVALTWRPGNDIDVVRPLSALAEANPGYVRLLLERDGSADVLLRFRPRRTGVVSLGELQLLSGGVRSTRSRRTSLQFPLGHVVVERGFDLQNVVYLANPHDKAAQRADEALQRSLARGIEIIALVGPGGVGKTRLVDEMVDRLMEVSADEADTDRPRPRLPAALRVEHVTDRSGNPRFLLDIALALAEPELQLDAIPYGDQRIVPDPRNALHDWVIRFDPLSSVRVKAAIELLSGRAQGSDPSPVVELLLRCMLARTHNVPAFVHLSNLHWATNAEITVLDEFLRRLREVAPSLRNGALIVLEGRTNEMLARGSSETTDAWEVLCSLPGAVRIPLDAWSEDNSAMFVRSVLRHIGSLPPAASGEDVLTQDVGWRRMQEHVLAVSSGNPMQIIEHVRLLLARKVLVFDENGTLVVAGAPAPSEDTAVSLLDMVKDRAEYLRRDRAYAEVIALLKILAELGLTVERTLFEAIAGASTDSRSRSRLVDLGIAWVPGGGRREFRFVHETYRAAFRELQWNEADGGRLRLAALARLEPVAELSAHRLVAWSRIKHFDVTSRVDTVRDALVDGIGRAERSRDFGAIASLCDALLELPQYVIDSGTRPCHQIRRTFAEALIGSGSWHKALEQLRLAASPSRPEVSRLERDLFTAQVANSTANILGDMLRCAEGLRVVQDGLTAIDRWARETNDQRIVQCREFLLNRRGVLLWFSGRADAGIRWQWQAYRSARRQDPGGEREMLFSNELGTALLHRYPLRGRSLLEHASRLLAEHRNEFSPMSDYVEAQLQMARLIAPMSADSPHDIEQSCREIADGRGRPASSYGACLAWLAAGAAAFLEDRFAHAQQYFTEALWLANGIQHKRALWKAHLGLATVFHEQGHLGPAHVHARDATDILVESLDIIGAAAKESWGAMIQLPLEYAKRLIRNDWSEGWIHRPSAISRAGQPFQVLHVRKGHHDVFLMG